jgi:DNA repair ATPase RecN
VAAGDDTGRRAKLFEGDIERSSKARRHPRPESASIVESVIEDDVTPLPQEPPDISQLDGFEDMPTTVQRAFKALWNTSREHDVAFAKLWDVRHVGSEITAMRQQLSQVIGFASSLRDVPEILRSHAGVLQRFDERMATRQKLDDRLERTLETLDGRLKQVEDEFREWKGTFKAFGDQVTQAVSRVTNDVSELEATVQARIEKLESEHKSALEKLETRVRSLEDTRTSMFGKLAGLTAALLVVAWLVEHFLIK